MKRIAVYGSLRKGDYNYDRCIPNAEVIEQVELQGWEMYDLGSYPAIVRGDGTVLFDIMDVTDEHYDRVESMELGAGYIAETVTLKGASEATLFYMKDEALAQYESWSRQVKLVESGDWIEYKALKETGLRGVRV